MNYEDDWRRELRDAAESGDCARLRALLADVPEGETVDSDLGERHTALLRASAKGRLEACALLLQAGANPGVRGTYGESPLQFAFDGIGTPLSVIEEGYRLFAAYGAGGEEARSFPQTIETHSRADVTPEARMEAHAKACAAAKRILGFDISWSWDRGLGMTHGRVWVAAGELPLLRRALDEACFPSAGSIRLRLSPSKVLPEGEPQVAWETEHAEVPPQRVTTAAGRNRTLLLLPGISESTRREIEARLA